MKRFGLILLIFVLALTTLACGVSGPLSGRTVRGSGRVVEETREIGHISGVELATIGTLHIEVGGEESLRVEAEDNLLEYIETEVHGGELRIDIQDAISLRTTKPIHYYLTVKTLEHLALSSSGDAEMQSLEAETFSASLSSSGSLTMEDLDAEKLTVSISSSGNMRIDTLRANRLDATLNSSGSLDIAGGEVEVQDITLSSSGNYNARNMESAEAKVRLSSSGDATLRVSDALNARLSSSGNVRYLGDPRVDASTSSSGRVTRIGE